MWEIQVSFVISIFLQLTNFDNYPHVINKVGITKFYKKLHLFVDKIQQM